MAVQGPIPAEFPHAFPRGEFVQSKDKATGLPLWQVDVIDGDPAARDKTVRVKVAAPDQPVLSPAAGGLPFVPVEFAGLTITPYVNPGGRLAYSQPGMDRRLRPGQRPATAERVARRSIGAILPDARTGERRGRTDRPRSGRQAAEYAAAVEQIAAASGPGTTAA